MIIESKSILLMILVNWKTDGFEVAKGVSEAHQDKLYDDCFAHFQILIVQPAIRVVGGVNLSLSLPE